MENPPTPAAADKAAALDAGANAPAEDKAGLAKPGAPAKDKTGPAKVPEIGGPKGPEPTRYGDWERGGLCIDF